MSIEAVAWALRQGVGDPIAKLILISIADHHNASTGECFPGRTRLAEAGCCDGSTVKRKLAKLVSDGWIAVVPRYTAGGRQTTNGYRITALTMEGRSLPPSPCETSKGGAQPAPPEGRTAMRPLLTGRVTLKRKAASENQGSGASGTAEPKPPASGQRGAPLTRERRSIAPPSPRGIAHARALGSPPDDLPQDRRREIGTALTALARSMRIGGAR